MKPEQFIREFGVEKARELLNADSDFKTYCLIDKSFWGESEGTCSFCVDLDDVKHLVGSLDRVTHRGGLSKTKDHLDYLISFGSEFAGVSKEEIKELQHDITVHESIYGGGE